MCLDPGWRRATAKEKRETTHGWKSFRFNIRDRLRFHYCLRPALQCRWLKANKSRIYSYDGIYYMSGFHVFASATDAENYNCLGVVRKVKFRGLRIVGQQDGAQTFICDEIYILPKRARRREVSK